MCERMVPVVYCVVKVMPTVFKRRLILATSFAHKKHWSGLPGREMFVLKVTI